MIIWLTTTTYNRYKGMQGLPSVFDDSQLKLPANNGKNH